MMPGLAVFGILFSPGTASVAETTGTPPATIEAGRDWIPLAAKPWIEPGSALDFSNVIPRHEPAGTFGRVVAVGDHFEFDGLPGVKQRFYGVNVCRDSCTPSTPEAAERFAANLARVGYNTVRVHHHERWLLEKDGNFAGLADYAVPDAECMDRFDDFVHACIRHGIYITTDLYVSRRIPWRDLGIDEEGFANGARYKIMCAFWEPAYSNLCAWSRNFLTHVNPYTGRSLAEEPALCSIALINEGNLGVYGIDMLKETHGVMEAWEKWCASRNRAGLAFPDRTDDPELARFLADAEMRLANRLRAFLRDELGCKAPISSINRGYSPVQYQLVRQKCFDYVDAHFYVDHPKYIGEQRWRLPSRCDNRNPMRGDRHGVPEIAFRRLLDKPFCVSEWNYASPGRYRGMGGMVMGAIGALQDWDGMWRFAWSAGIEDVEKPETMPMHYWEMCRDPLSLATERAALCLFLRGDIASLSTECPVVLDEDALLDPDGDAPECDAREWRRAAWMAKVGTLVVKGREQAETNKFSADFSTPASQVFAELAARGADKPGNGAVSIDQDAGMILINTPRTCGGFAEGGRHVAGALSFEIADLSTFQPFNLSTDRCRHDMPTTIWASSLDGKPLTESARVLVTHLTDLQNTGARFADADRSILLDWGRLPHLVRVGEAKVELKLQCQLPIADNSFRVFALGTDGRRECEVPSDWNPAAGILRFTASVRQPFGACLYYEIVRELRGK